MAQALGLQVTEKHEIGEQRAQLISREANNAVQAAFNRFNGPSFTTPRCSMASSMKCCGRYSKCGLTTICREWWNAWSVPKSNGFHKAAAARLILSMQ
jgi:hypothetical protein